MTLGIRRDHIAVVNEGGLADIPSVEWQPELVLEHVERAVKRHSIQTVSV